MPFTPSHAVVALPFIRTPLVPAAIAVGAMSPDLPLFVRGVFPSYSVTHDIRWLPLTMVVALVLLLVWRCVLRPAVRELSPDVLAVRLPPAWDGGVRASWRETFPSGPALLLLVASLAVGVASHILWDLFTHEGRWGSEVLPILDEHWGPLTGYKWLQHGSSAIGLAILGVWALVRVSGSAPTPIVRLLPGWVRVTWMLSLPAALLIALGVGLALEGPLTDDWTINHLAYFVLPPACAVWGVLTIGLACLVQVARSRSREVPR